MKLHDYRVTAHLMEVARESNGERKAALLRGISALSTLDSLSTLPYLVTVIDSLMLNGLSVCCAPGFLREKEKGKKKKRETHYNAEVT